MSIALAVSAALVCAFGISICAATPEFIWRGLYVVVSHATVSDLLSALLIGLILAFFVEPVSQRVRLLFEGRHPEAAEHTRPRDVLFTAALSFAFALASICIHDAITAYVPVRGAGVEDLTSGVQLTVGWAIGPFSVAVAWLSARIRWLAGLTGIIAIASGSISGLLFAWPIQVMVTTTVPTIAILALGYRQFARHEPKERFARCARVVAVAGALWLVAALLADLLLNALGLERYDLYDAAGYWIDVRFYIGWALGLALMPMPDFKIRHRA